MPTMLRLEEENMQLRSRVNQLQDKLNAAESENRDLRLICKENSEQCDDLVESECDAWAQVAELQQKLDAASTAKDSLIAQLEEKQSTIEKLEANIFDMKASSSHEVILKAEIESLKRESNKVAFLKMEKAARGVRIYRLVEENAQLTQSLTKAEELNWSLTEGKELAVKEKHRLQDLGQRLTQSLIDAKELALKQQLQKKSELMFNAEKSTLEELQEQNRQLTQSLIDVKELALKQNQELQKLEQNQRMGWQ